MCFCNKKCDWCKKKKPDTVQFKGYHKYTGMIICQECFDKKWPSVYILKTDAK